MQKRIYPKTVFRKKVFKGFFWTGFLLALFLSVVAIVRLSNFDTNQVEAKQAQPKENMVNFATREGAQSFAQNFAREYFDWQNSDEGKKSRIDRLQTYLAIGLDEQAGLSFEGMEWNSSLSTSQVWNVEATGHDSANITLRVEHILNRTISQDAEDAPSEEKSGPYEKYFVVPIQTDGKSFVVHQIPYFISAPEKPQITSDTSINEDGKLQDTKLQAEIISALNTFFKVYTNGSQEELSYYIKGDYIESMTGVITFKEVKNLIIKQDQSTNQYKVSATVVFQENQSKAEVIYPYELILLKEDNRWFIKSIKNH
ncbi:conjugal transfer protein (plasmid) [Niallia sp. XMNu-256]|uniref:conjugal transfer protein n=1 Tax=Niallia sp. XMNu-256 TaxID=3082444 RepID=UPI0030D2C02C